MVKSIVALALVEAAAAGTLAVTFEDCGAKHGTVTKLEPTTVETGTTAELTGTGTIDEDVTSAKFVATVKALGKQIASCSGDGTTDITCKLPLGAGSVTVKAISYPLQKGDVSLVTEVTTSSLIPSSLANVDVEVRATEQNNEDVVCLNVHTAQQKSFQATAQCSDDEQQVLSAMSGDDLGKIGGDCGKASLSGLSFDQDKFNTCFMGKVSVGQTCSQCYATAGQYGFDHCKAKCLLGWCKQGCLDCAAPAQADVGTCTGVTTSDATPCLDDIAV